MSTKTLFPLLIFLAIPAFAQSAPSAESNAVHFNLNLVSEPGDPLGYGKNYELNDKTATLTSRFVPSYTNKSGALEIEIVRTGDVGKCDLDYARLSFAAGGASPLVAGDYPNASFSPLNESSPGMGLVLWDSLCSSSKSSFQVRDLNVDQQGKLRSGTFTFESHCSDKLPPIRGTLTVTSVSCDESLTTSQGALSECAASLAISDRALNECHGQSVLLETKTGQLSRTIDGLNKTLKIAQTSLTDAQNALTATQTSLSTVQGQLQASTGRLIATQNQLGATSQQLSQIQASYSAEHQLVAQVCATYNPSLPYYKKVLSALCGR